MAEPLPNARHSHPIPIEEAVRWLEYWRLASTGLEIEIFDVTRRHPALSATRRLGQGTSSIPVLATSNEAEGIEFLGECVYHNRN